MPEQNGNLFPRPPVLPTTEQGLFPTIPVAESSTEEENAQIIATGAENGIVEPSRPSISERGLARVGEELWGGQEPEKPKDELADLFEVPQPEDNDMDTSDLFDADIDPDIDDLIDTDLDDLINVPNEAIMGTPPPPRKPKPKFRRTNRPYNPPTMLGGMRG